MQDPRDGAAEGVPPASLPTQVGRTTLVATSLAGEARRGVARVGKIMACSTSGIDRERGALWTL